MLGSFRWFFTVALVIFGCLRFLCSCSNCYECRPKGTSDDVTPLEVCQKDDEDGADFDVRIAKYKNEGYVCK